MVEIENNILNDKWYLFFDTNTEEAYNLVKNEITSPDSKFISDDYGLFTTYRETCGNKLIFFDSENERKSCFNYLTSKLLRYYSSKIRTNQRIPWQFVPVIDFKEDCTDSYLKKYFGLTDEEYKNIFC